MEDSLQVRMPVLVRLIPPVIWIGTDRLRFNETFYYSRQEAPVMAIPPQFLKKSKAAAAEDAKDGGKDDSKEDSNGNLIKKSPKKGKGKLDPKAAKRAAMLALIQKG